MLTGIHKSVSIGVIDSIYLSCGVEVVGLIPGLGPSMVIIMSMDWDIYGGWSCHSQFCYSLHNVLAFYPGRRDHYSGVSISVTVYHNLTVWLHDCIITNKSLSDPRHTLKVRIYKVHLSDIKHMALHLSAVICIVVHTVHCGIHIL